MRIEYLEDGYWVCFVGPVDCCGNDVFGAFVFDEYDQDAYCYVIYFMSGQIVRVYVIKIFYVVSLSRVFDRAVSRCWRCLLEKVSVIVGVFIGRMKVYL